MGQNPHWDQEKTGLPLVFFSSVHHPLPPSGCLWKPSSWHKGSCLRLCLEVTKTFPWTKIDLSPLIRAQHFRRGPRFLRQSEYHMFSWQAGGPSWLFVRGSPPSALSCTYLDLGPHSLSLLFLHLHHIREKRGLHLYLQGCFETGRRGRVVWKAVEKPASEPFGPAWSAPRPQVSAAPPLRAIS